MTRWNVIHWYVICFITSITGYVYIIYKAVN